MKPAISVMMINRNGAHFLKEALSSLVRQSLKDWELIFIDDASSDDSVKIIKNFLPDKRIRIITHDQRVGIGKTRHEAVNLAEADIIGILDSDDALEKTALEIMTKAHQNNPQGLIYSQFIICDENLNPIRKANSGPIPASSSNLKLNCISHLATFKKSAYIKTAGYNPRLNLAEDKDIFYKLEEVSKTLFIDKPLYLYRVHKKSVSSYGLKRFLAQLFHLVVRLQAHLRRQKNNKIIKRYQQQIIN